MYIYRGPEQRVRNERITIREFQSIQGKISHMDYNSLHTAVIICMQPFIYNIIILNGKKCIYIRLEQEIGGGKINCSLKGNTSYGLWGRRDLVRFIWMLFPPMLSSLWINGKGIRKRKAQHTVVIYILYIVLKYDTRKG